MTSPAASSVRSSLGPRLRSPLGLAPGGRVAGWMNGRLPRRWHDTLLGSPGDDGAARRRVQSDGSEIRVEPALCQPGALHSATAGPPTKMQEILHIRNRLAFASISRQSHSRPTGARPDARPRPRQRRGGARPATEASGIAASTTPAAAGRSGARRAVVAHGAAHRLESTWN